MWGAPLKNKKSCIGWRKWLERTYYLIRLTGCRRFRMDPGMLPPPQHTHTEPTISLWNSWHKMRQWPLVWNGYNNKGLDKFIEVSVIIRCDVYALHNIWAQRQEHQSEMWP